MTQEQAIIDLYFDGDRALYEEYKALCRDQFKLDVAQGDQACAQGDVTGLRHLVHSLNTVLGSLGRADLSELAVRIEQQTADGNLDAACAIWRALRDQLPSALD